LKKLEKRPKEKGQKGFCSISNPAAGIVLEKAKEEGLGGD